MDRLDSYLVTHNLVTSRSKGQYEIEKGNVLVNGKVVTKASFKVSDEDQVMVKDAFDYVSRGALKLLKAKEVFSIDFNDKVMLDIGSSTGGFSEVALRNNIKKVIAVDVGKDQFDDKLKLDNRVELHEETDIRDYTVKDKIDIVTIDVSFISVTKFIDKLGVINPSEIVLLIKPQFECGKDIADKYKGIPLNKEVHINVINSIINSFCAINYNIQDLTYSPITGGSGNIEYLGYFTKDSKKEISIEQVIEDSFKELK